MTSKLQIILDAQTSAASAELNSISGDIRNLGTAATESSAEMVGLGESTTATAESMAGMSEAGRVLTQSEIDATAATTAAATAAGELTAVTAEEIAAVEAAAAADVSAAAATEEMAAASMTAKEAMSGLMSAGLAVGAVMLATKAAYDNTIGSASELGDQVRRLGMDIGASAEDASKLIYASTIVGVSVDTLTHALDAAVRAMKSNRSEGIEPNIEGLATLADMYNALPPGVQRVQFLMDNFGKSGAEMGELMQLGGQGIRDMGDQATAAGAVLTEQAAAGLEIYDRKVNKLGADVKAAGTQLGLMVLGLDDQAVAVGLGNEAIAKGIITENDWNIIRANAESGVKSYAVSIQELTDKIKQHDQALDQDADKAAAVAVATQAQADAFHGMADNVSALTSRYPALTQGERDLADAAADVAKAVDDQRIAQLVQAGVAGTVTKNTDAYNKVLDGNAAKIKALQDEIAKYTALQGQSITVVDKGQYSAEQLAVAQERLSIAEERLNEYHGKSQASLDSLRLSVDQAQAKVVEMSGHLADATTTTADYSTKIGEDTAALNELTGANNDAQTAMREANKEFVYQQATAGLTGQALLDVSLAMGEIDEPTYNAETAIMASRQAFDEHKITLEQFEADLLGVTNVLNGIPQATAGVPDALGASEDAFYGAAAAAAAATTNIADMAAAEAALHDANVTITTTFLSVYGPSGPGYEPPRRAAGGPVLAGMPYMVGENGPEPFVPSQNGTIYPHGTQVRGAGGGDTINNYIYDTKTAALVASDARQRKLAKLNGYMN